MRLVLLTVTLGIAAIPSAGQACRVFRSANQRLSDGYRSGAISAVALVTVTKADYVAEPSGDAHPWTASATIDRMLESKASGKLARFDRGRGSAACDDLTPLPRGGDR